MAHTLPEMAKSGTGDVFRDTVIRMFAEVHPLLQVLPMKPITGNAYHYDQESTLPSVEFRGVNEAYSESTGIVNPFVETLRILGGDADTDRALVKQFGPKRRTDDERRKLTAMAQKYVSTFIKGDTAVDFKGFDGLQKRIVGSQLIAAGATSGGDALSIMTLDTAIDAVDGANALLMMKQMRRRLTQASKTDAIGGQIRRTVNDFGQQVTQYNDIPIVEVDVNGMSEATLAFNEANPGGGSAVGTSIYICRLEEGYLSGMQNGAPEAYDLGEIDSKPVFRSRFEWLCGMAAEHGRSAARIWGIKDAAIVA